MFAMLGGTHVLCRVALGITSEMSGNGCLVIDWLFVWQGLSVCQPQCKHVCAFAFYTHSLFLRLWHAGALCVSDIVEPLMAHFPNRSVCMSACMARGQTPYAPSPNRPRRKTI